MQSKNPLKIVFFEPRNLIRPVLAAFIQKLGNVEELIECKTHEEVKQRILNHATDILIISLHASYKSCLNTVYFVNLNKPTIKTMIIGETNNENLFFDVISYGANCYVSRYITIENFRKAINELSKNGFYIEQNSVNSLFEFSNRKTKNYSLKEISDFTNREIQLLELFCKEYTVKEIANNLGITIKTVENYKNRLIDKTNSHTILGAVLFAIRNNYITLY
jgi:DNA-binding NarL/FixJ family response regulator